MRTIAKSVACPVCGKAATLTLYEQVDRVTETEGHSIDFECGNQLHMLDEPQKVKLWAADRMGS